MEGLVSPRATLPSFTHRPNKFSARRSVPMDLHTKKSTITFASSSIRAQQVLLLTFNISSSSFAISELMLEIVIIEFTCFCCYNFIIIYTFSEYLIFRNNLNMFVVF
jgi:hypothetical protein